MAKKEDNKGKKEINDNPKEFRHGNIQPRSISDEMQASYLDYAMSVIVSRALPDVRDGLKPVHRRILYAMQGLGLGSKAKFRKSATVVGEVLGKYHPHGDIAVYDTMVRMAQDFSLRYLLVDGQGNFGSIDGDGPAAYRYTEARMTAVAEEMLVDIEKDTVNFVPNFDASRTEPSVLPAKLPQLILNGSVGIAVGMATAIPPHNLNEVIDAVVCLINDPGATIEDLMEFVQGPDFPTGACIYDQKEIQQAYATGKGSILMRAIAKIEERKNGKFQVIVTEIPYQVNKATLLERIADLVKTQKIQGIADLRDESDKEGIRVVVDLKKDAYPKKVLNQLYKFTQMQSAFHVNMIALVDGIQPRVLTLKDILEEYIKYRREVVVRRTKYELQKAKDRAHILEGLLKALKNIEKVIETIKKSKTREEAHKNLVKKFKLSDRQAEAILLMRLQTLAGLEQKKIKDEYEEIKKLIKELEEILRSPKKVMEIIKKELEDLKKRFGDERRTRVIKQAVGDFEQEDLIPNEATIVTLTQGNYIKRMPPKTYRSQHRGGKGIIGMTTREEDTVEHVVSSNTHDYILFFTNQGRVFQTRVFEIPVGTRQSKGQAIVNLVQVAPEEKVTAVITIKDFEAGKYLMMATKCGVVKKTEIIQFAKARRSGLIAIRLRKEDELCWVKFTSGNDDVIMATSGGLALRFREKNVRSMGRAAAGVRGIRCKKGDWVEGFDIVKAGGEILAIMENGYGKRTDEKQFTAHNRGGVGMKIANITKKTGKIVDARAIEKGLTGDLIVMSHNGQIIRTPIENIPVIGRATQGVRIMKLNDNDTVATLATIPKRGEREEGEEEPGKREETTGVEQGGKIEKQEKPIQKTEPKATAQKESKKIEKKSAPKQKKSTPVTRQKKPAKKVSKNKPRTKKPQAKKIKKPAKIKKVKSKKDKAKKK